MDNFTEGGSSGLPIVPTYISPMERANRFKEKLLEVLELSKNQNHNTEIFNQLSSQFDLTNGDSWQFMIEDQGEIKSIYDIINEVRDLNPDERDTLISALRKNLDGVSILRNDRDAPDSRRYTNSERYLLIHFGLHNDHLPQEAREAFCYQYNNINEYIDISDISSLSGIAVLATAPLSPASYFSFSAPFSAINYVGENLCER